MNTERWRARKCGRKKGETGEGEGISEENEKVGVKRGRTRNEKIGKKANHA